MDLYRGRREILTQWIGVLATSVASIGSRASNNAFNGRPISQYRCSKLLNDEMIIRRFYTYETLIHHNFVVFQTELGHTFKVHLMTDPNQGDRSLVYVEIGPTRWGPTSRYVGRCNKKARDLKRFVKHEVRKFGTYEVGFNDCRHFARKLAAFLAW
jgi:hypothetical protein